MTEPASSTSQRILSIQSHVVSGYVGNKSAVFPLQLLGFDVDVINSVHFSNHTGYPKGWEGDVLAGNQLRAILQGLQRNQLLDDTGHVLTGYIGSESFLEAVLEVVQALRARPSTSSREERGRRVRFVCDPVLGDRGEFYVPKELVGLYREKVLPLADVVTPNEFEVEQLTNIKIETMEDAKRACDSLHSMGPSLVFITSMILLGGESMTILASQRVRISEDDDNNSNHPDSFHTAAWRIDCPILPFDFTGTGDLCASLLLAHSALQPDNIPAVMEKVINTMFAVLQRTMESAGTTVQSRELKLIQSKDIIEHPPSRFKAEPI